MNTNFSQLKFECTENFIFISFWKNIQIKIDRHYIYSIHFYLYQWEVQFTFTSCIKVDVQTVPVHIALNDNTFALRLHAACLATCIQLEYNLWAPDKSLVSTTTLPAYLLTIETIWFRERISKRKYIPHIKRVIQFLSKFQKSFHVLIFRKLSAFIN